MINAPSLDRGYGLWGRSRAGVCEAVGTVG